MRITKIGSYHNIVEIEDIGKLYVINSVLSTDFNRLHVTFPILTLSSCQALILFSGEVLLITSSMALQ